MRYQLLMPAVLLVWSATTHAASFNCAKAKSTVEKAICSDSELSVLDEEMVKVYKLAVKQHPVKHYVLARQQDWLSLNKYCDPSRFVPCLKQKYKQRISQLSDVENLIIYANTENFSYANGDAVAEIRKTGNKYLIDVWGGFRIHLQATRDNGKATFTGCEFIGTYSTPSAGSATSLEYPDLKFVFKLDGKNLSYVDSRQICSGFGGLPNFLKLVEKK